MNNADSVFQAVNYLIGRGYHQIGYLKGEVRIQNFKYRAEGYERALKMKGIPVDISIIGFDDIVFCSVFTPALTTVRVFKKELGQLAVRHLVKLIKKKSEIKVRMQICNELVERGSVASIKSDKTEAK